MVWAGQLVGWWALWSLLAFYCPVVLAVRKVVVACVVSRFFFILAVSELRVAKNV